ncbi:rho GTPase-activating protein 19 isoform X2 [Leptinotarsa decemlineata]|uniref:rho GTPase-activating protein 19 isoform X2 n=1 Tax=Leptinotarsa decemlineata TaxID=7539 RepID=UPI003D309087
MMCSVNKETDESVAERFKRDYTEQFHILVRMHLSFLLDINTDERECFSEKGKLKKWNLAPFFKKAKFRGVMEGAPLTQEGICQVYQLIEFLKKEENMKSEGIFRRTGSLERQHDLRNLLNRGVTLMLEEGTYNVHDCASVLKSFLSELPDPLLTEGHFPVYWQIAESCGITEQKIQEGKLLEALQLLLLLLPTENKVLLKDILELLHTTASFESFNKMSPDNLAKLFTPHLLCPRKLPPETLLKDSQALFGIISFMIKKSPELFKIPNKLIMDFKAKYEKKRIVSPTKRLNESVTDAASTVFTFVDHERTAKENESNPTETALAQLYAHIQSLPESSKKRKLVKQFNRENGYGTPLQVMKSGNPKNRSFGDSIKRRIFHRGLTRKKEFLLRTSTSDEMLNETMMTPRSRKPVLLFSGTNINTLHKNDQTSYIMGNLTEENSCESETPDTKNIKKSKSEGDMEKEPREHEIVRLNRSDSPKTLSNTFKEYLKNREMVTLSSPEDSSFFSQTDDFNSTDFKDCNESMCSKSLLHCLNGNEPDEIDIESEQLDSNIEEKELVLKPKQFDLNGKPIIFETSF